ncbi:MAG: hypothetical protein AMXMBFR13_28030 [Phycisphaerae bacterium]
MSDTIAWARTAAMQGFISLCSPDARKILLDDRAGQPRCSPYDDREHLQAALAWILHAQDCSADGGVAAMYSFVEGWIGSYPETTGILVPTLFNAAAHLGREELVDRAVDMIEWLLTQQQEDGAFQGGFVGSPGPARVCSTGQILRGLVRAVNELNDGLYRDAACRAGDWLIAVQDPDGGWSRRTLNGIAHAYNVRTAWSLLQLAQETGELRYHDAAISNADWTLAQQCPSGWFRQNTFTSDTEAASLESIAATIEGLLEIGSATQCSAYIEAARAAAFALHGIWIHNHYLPGTFREDWASSTSWRCLPGEAHLAWVWLRLDQINERREFTAAALELIERLKSAQFINEELEYLHGSVSGSYPLDGAYERYCLVNWGPKYLIDALLLKAHAHQKRQYAHSQTAAKAVNQSVML